MSTALDPLLLPGMMKSEGVELLGYASAASGGGVIDVCLSQSEETYLHRKCYKALPGDIFYCTRCEATRLGSVPTNNIFQHGG